MHYVDKPVDPGSRLLTFENRTLDSAPLREFALANLPGRPFPPAAWDLDALTMVAFYYHPDLDRARAELESAQARMVTAGARPGLSIGAAPGRNTTTLVPSPWLLSLSVTLPVETAGKRGHRLAEAGLLADAARLSVASAAWGVRGRLRDRLLELYAATRARDLLDQQMKGQDETLAILERQLAIGAVSPFEVTQGRLARSATAIAVLDADRRRKEAVAGLASAMGVSVSTLRDVDLSFDGFTRALPAVPVPQARREALLNRPDLRTAVAEYAAAQAALQLAIAGQYPDLELGPGYEFDQGDNKWTLGIGLTLPVFGRQRGPIAEAEARRSAAAARVDAVQATAIGEVERALAGLDGAAALVAGVSTSVDELTQQAARARRMYDLGDISRQSLVATQVELRVAAVAKLEAEVKVQAALGQLEQALARPVDPTGWLSPSPALEASPRRDPR